MTSAFLNEFKKVVDLTGKQGNTGLRSQANEVFNEFVHAEKFPSVGSCLKYKMSKVQGCIEDQDVDANFCTTILILQNTLTGRLQVKDNNLPESLEPGDVVFIDPTAIHWVTKTAREK